MRQKPLTDPFPDKSSGDILDIVAPPVGAQSGEVRLGTPEGDTSFRLAADGLTPDTLYLLSSAVYEQSQGSMKHDIARLVTALQGLINREYESNKVFLYWEDASDTDTFWKEYLQTDGKLFDGLTEMKIATLDEFFSIFAAQLKTCGIVAWDPAVPATANAAATICGLDGYLPIRFDTAGNSLYSRLLALGAPEKLSLAGKFTGKGEIPDIGRRSTGSAKTTHMFGRWKSI